MENGDETRRQIERTRLEERFSRTIDERVERILDIDHPLAIPHNYFAEASAECLYLYRDGFFIGTVMMTHAIAEAVREYLIEQNDIRGLANEKPPEKYTRLKSDGIITQACEEAFTAIAKSYRNAIHHMNPPVGQIDFADLAKSNIKHLVFIWTEIWGCDLGEDGRFYPRQCQYWPVGENGLARAHLL